MREYIKQTLNQPASTLLGTYRDADDETHFFDPPYQRGAVWTLTQKRALIKSFVSNLPTGSIILSVHEECYDHPHVVVVDGKQRIMALREFASGGFSVPREWFDPEDIKEYARDFHFVIWHELSERGRRTFENITLSVIEFVLSRSYIGKGENGQSVWVHNDHDTTTRLEAEVYLLINAGGTAHTDEDLARAIGITETVAEAD